MSKKIFKVPVIAMLTGLFAVMASPAYALTNLTSANCGDVLSTANETYVLTEDMTCSTRHGLIIAAEGIIIDGNGYTLSGHGLDSSGNVIAIEDRNCEVLTAAEGVADRMWCQGHPCRQATDGNVLDSGIVNANTSLGTSCYADAPMGQGGCDDVTIKNLKITGWCDGIWLSGDCDTNGDGTPGDERRLTGLVVEGNFIYANGNGDCGTYTASTDGDGGDWTNTYYNDGIFTAQIGLDVDNSTYAFYAACQMDGVEYPDLVCTDVNSSTGNCNTTCVPLTLNDDRNIIQHNKIYGQEGCAAVSCPGGNGINIQGGLEFDEAADVTFAGSNDIKKNVIKNCDVSGIHFTHATTHNRIHGNYLMGNGLGGIANGCVWCSGSYIYDNTLHGNYGAGIAVNAMSKINNNIIEDTQALANSELAKLGYGSLPGDGIFAMASCHSTPASYGICTSGQGSELHGNTVVGSTGVDIKVKATSLAYGDENMCGTANAHWGLNGPDDSPCRYLGGAQLNCRGDINHDCTVGGLDLNILQGEYGSDPEDCCDSFNLN